jgi:predicted ATP-grasp superfamily ATP-dependent carboligase
VLSALLDDFARVPGVQPITLWHHELPSPLDAQFLRLVRPDQEENAFRETAAASDFTLVIAPEFDNLLLTRARWVEEAGGQLLGPSPAAIELTGDKLALAQSLRRYHVPTPESAPCPWGAGEPTQSYPLVSKPRYGAGSLATFLIRNAGDWVAFQNQAIAEGWHGEMLVQPFVPGQPASVSFLIGSHGMIPLPPALQHLSVDGRFRYDGGEIPLPAPQCQRATSLAQRAVQSIPGLKGYIGVDVVLGYAPDGSQDWVIEINPRLTTSYVGLRRLAASNLAAALLQTVIGADIPELTWSPGPVRFLADGTISLVATCSDTASGFRPASDQLEPHSRQR